MPRSHSAPISRLLNGHPQPICKYAGRDILGKPKRRSATGTAIRMGIMEPELLQAVVGVE